jgi:hypothetical protein
VLTFRRNILPPSSGIKISMLLRNFTSTQRCNPEDQHRHLHYDEAVSPLDVPCDSSTVLRFPSLWSVQDLRPAALHIDPALPIVTLVYFSLALYTCFNSNSTLLINLGSDTSPWGILLLFWQRGAAGSLKTGL